MNQLTHSLIIFLSLILIQARASRVEELTAQLTSQASLLTQFAIAGDAGYQNQQALNQWNRQLHVEEMKLISELSSRTEVKEYLASVIGIQVTDEEAFEWLLRSALYGVDLNWAEAFEEYTPGREKIYSTLSGFLVSVSQTNGLVLQYSDREKPQYLFTSDFDQYLDTKYGIYEITQNAADYDEYLSNIKKARVAPLGAALDPLTFSTLGEFFGNAGTGLPKGVWDGVVSLSTTITSPIKTTEALLDTETYKNAYAGTKRSALSYFLLRDIYDMQGDEDAYAAHVGDTFGRMLGGYIGTGAGIGAIGKVGVVGLNALKGSKLVISSADIAKKALNTARSLTERKTQLSLAAAGMLALEDLKLLKNSKDLLTIPYAEVRKSTSVLEKFGLGWQLVRLQGLLDDLAEQHLLPKFRSIDPNLKAGYTGSFRTGTVGNPKKPTFGQPIDLNNFDVDFWIESNILFNQYGTKLIPDKTFREILSKTEGFEGLKPGKSGFTIKFKPSAD
jgi:hypothetical protein